MSNETDEERYIRETHEAAQVIQRACFDLLQRGYNDHAVESGLLSYAVKAVIHRQGATLAAQWLRETADVIADDPDAPVPVKH